MAALAVWMTSLQEAGAKTGAGAARKPMIRSSNSSHNNNDNNSSHNHNDNNSSHNNNDNNSNSNSSKPETTTISSHSHRQKQTDTHDDRISMYTDDSSTFVAWTDMVKKARTIIERYEKTTAGKLHDGKTILMKLGRTR